MKLKPISSLDPEPKQVHFNKLISGAPVRFVEIKRAQYVRHVIMIVCGMDDNRAGEVWRIMPDSRETEVEDLHLFLVLGTQINLSTMSLALLCS